MSIKKVPALLVFAAALTALCCQGPGKEAESPSAQQIIDTIAARHPEVVRLTLHAVPRGEQQSRIIASNVAAKIGKPSDPEDLRALQTGEEVVLQEGEHLDVTVPVSDATGKRTSVAGVLLRDTTGRTRDQLIADARGIAAEVSEAIRSAGQPLW